MADLYPVAYIHDQMRGAPVLNNANGTLIDLLDALLITGWGTAAPTGIVVTAGIATATFASPIAWEVGAVILVSDSSPAPLNGRARVLTSVDSTLTWATAAADGSYSGASIKYAPAGWLKPFSDAGAYKAVYQSQHPRSEQRYLRVNDSYGLIARVCAYESMSGVDTGTNIISYAAVDGPTSVWQKSYSGATARSYLLAADPRTLLVALYQGYAGAGTLGTANIRGFGDPIVLASSDSWATFLSADSQYDVNNNYVGYLGSGGALSGGQFQGGITLARSITGAAGFKACSTYPESGTKSVPSGSDGWGGAAPSSITGNVLISRMLIAQDNASRAIVPGVFYVPQTNARSVLPAGAVFDGSGEWAGRRLKTVWTGVYSTGSSPGAALIDLTGPWRED